MKKTSLYLSLLLGSMGVSAGTTVYASDRQYLNTNQDTLSSNQDYPFLSIHKERVGFYNTTFQGKDHELVTLEFRDKIQDIIAESDTLRAQIHKEKALHKKISALRQRIDENNGLLEQQKKLF